MLTDDQITEALALIDSRYQKVTELYLRKVGETINKIGKLNQSSINLLIQLRRMGVDMRTINRELRKATKLSQKDIKALYRKAAQEANTDARFLYVTKGVQPDSIRWERLVESIWMQSAGTMENFSRTTVVADSYREAVDEAVQAVTMGVGDYNSAIRSTMKRIGTAGMKVQYESGARKRLDSAVRMNVLDGVRQVQQKAQELIGEEIGADGVDITAHPMSAPDHEPVQGRRFDLANFQLMQAGRPFEDVDGKRYKAFSRPITQWHCRHLVYYILLGISRRMYTDEQLQAWEEENHRGVTFDGQHYTRYEATQLMRKIELQIRRQKDTAILAKASGDDILRRECQANISKLTAKYKSVAESASLKTRFEKTRVEGFKPVKENSVANTGKDGTMEQKKTEKEVPDVHNLTQLDIEKYKCVTEDIATKEVIITDERIQHIKDRHPNDFERYEKYMVQIIEEPDYILQSEMPNTAFVLKEIVEAEERFQLILRLKVSSDPQSYKNSVITFLKISEKKWNKYLRNKKILYKHE